ncbi:cyclic lactone autoinducer peptide [Neglecta sp. X4]|nr:cyclic lactone autoinducer peptide [Neglectibacter sp. 59]NBJ73741.1 cyclic lactone autoinducer peptide [Neglectibacter sp. X4]NCE81433.1 cyclic lactone autoinducer peptide [Neglectibacter sp. X58]
MTSLWSAIASLIETLANLGAGALSCGNAYEPEVPEELRK